MGVAQEPAEAIVSCRDGLGRAGGFGFGDVG